MTTNQQHPNAEGAVSTHPPLQPYVAGELSKQEEQECLAHVSQCDTCQKELEDMQRTRSIQVLSVLSPQTHQIPDTMDAFQDLQRRIQHARWVGRV